ncbi:pyrroline-5-carboxylate reductase [Aliiroseovarius sp. KMU-50]|uniref:Pyrroline-5-carboxylate reductase n=1 Tax=Aliiroseovarius salicola TaxID=3009082 RepID=A0ABT4VYJ8_9RHOB|nr:pyrroline-5-carboxylate reductase [Aliiroseovarius sp. KMU-50]MDA5093328.1 pyrroline-5-carboxylate reductase [Aliiroseovarius sp. KMU-50]
MNMDDLKARGLVLLGCGKMGSAMLEGWLGQGLPASSVWVKDPYPSGWLKGLEGLNLNTALPVDPAIVLIAVKPQMMSEALPELAPLGNGKTLFLSVAAGTPISTYENMLGSETPIIRAMPNTPAAISRGITAICGNAHSNAAQMDLAEALLKAVGQVVRLDGEHQMDAVTAVSGSGPAYVFHLIETLAAAGEAEGLPVELSMQLAKATVAGAGALAEAAEEDPSQLRVNVTSPGGTTAAALGVLMDETDGFPALLTRAVKAAADRSKELANG